MVLQTFTSLALVALAALTECSPLQQKRQTDGTQPVGTNPITKFTTKLLGNQTADNSCSHRDLGFTGSIAGKWYAIYGDTSWCAAGVTDPDKDTPGFHGMVRDSVSAMTSNPLKVHDLGLNKDFPVPHQNQFVPFNAAWGETNQYGFGGTSLVETNASTATGALFYLINGNDTGLIGAGVAKVQVIGGTPTVTQRYGTNGYWWDCNSNARYGDVAAYRDVNSDYIYAWGGAPNSATDWVSQQYVYLTRVHAADAFDLSKYEYWWGQAQGWSTTRLTTFTAETAVFWMSGQGQIVWSKFFNCYIFVHLGIGNGQVLLRTATALQGPWTPDVVVYTDTELGSGLAYAGVAHPYLDASGQTLTVSWTNSNDNYHIKVAKITFSKEEGGGCRRHIN